MPTKFDMAECLTLVSIRAIHRGGEGWRAEAVRMCRRRAGLRASGLPVVSGTRGTDHELGSLVRRRTSQLSGHAWDAGIPTIVAIISGIFADPVTAPPRLPSRLCAECDVQVLIRSRCDRRQIHCAGDCAAPI
jgi:hypothetical protein